jgi:hypothetical protein
LLVHIIKLSYKYFSRTNSRYIFITLRLVADAPSEDTNTIVCNDIKPAKVFVRRELSPKEKRVCMKKLLLTIFSIFTLAAANAQTDSWQILFNQKIVFKGNADKPDGELLIKTPWLKSTDKITIKYTSATADDSWKRTFYINDSSDNNILTIPLSKQTGAISVSAGKLSQLMKSKQPLFIYTIATPKNKALAASVRVRRILLCKIEWK